MNFKFICPFCNQHLDCEDTLENQLCNCPSCGGEIIPTKLKTNGINIEKLNHPTPTISRDNVSTDKQQIIINNYVNGQPQNYYQPQAFAQTKQPCKRWVYFLWGLFFSNIGIHCFYAGYKNDGIAHIIVSILLTLGGAGGIALNLVVQFIWWIIDLIVQTKDAYGRPMI